MSDTILKLSGKIVDVVNSRIFKGTITVDNGVIVNIIEDDNDIDQIIMPGLVDSHVHIESSLLVPTEFARLVVPHGTVASVSDPHEIANILGIKGVQYMIEEGALVPFKFFFSAPSCVPATVFETSGCTLDAAAVDELLSKEEIKYLGEMMNYPGVVYDDEEVMKKIESAKRHGKPIDGHAPLLSGDELKKYANAGISTDHECSTLQEALDKAALGMIIQVREGSAANNFNALIPLIEHYPENVMFCTDDAHPHELINTHINGLVKRAIALGYNELDVIKAATLTPVRHYNLEVGLLQVNDPADMIVVDNLTDFNVINTYINGELVAANGRALLKPVVIETINNFQTEHVCPDDFKVLDKGKDVRMIGVIKGELITEMIIDRPKSLDGYLECDIERDILKIAVISRYEKKKLTVGFVKNFGLKKGALASSVAHDSHNIVVIGCSDREMTEAVNMIIDSKGGFSVYSEEEQMMLSLPVAGLMTDEDAHKVANEYVKIRDLSIKLGSQLSDPFMTMGFMPLLVIPFMKISDKGIFDCQKFEITSLYVDE